MADFDCDSILQFIAETNSKYNFAPAKLTTNDTNVLLHNTSYNGTHAHQRSNQQSQLQGPTSYVHALNNIGDVTIANNIQLYCNIPHYSSSVQPTKSKRINALCRTVRQAKVAGKGAPSHGMFYIRQVCLFVCLF